MENLSIQSTTVQVNVPSNSYEPNNFTHINNLEKKEVQFPNTGKDFGLTKESNTIQEDIPQQEIWKNHPNFPGYEFSSMGRVYSYNSRPNKFLRGKKTNNGYINLILKDSNNQMKYPLLSRIIYELFGDNVQSLPHKEVDHIRRQEKKNNNINNLRISSSSQNKANTGKIKRNHQGNTPSSSFIGLSWHIKQNKWISNIRIKGKRFHIGVFKFPENGVLAYQKVARQFKDHKFYNPSLPDGFQSPMIKKEDRDGKADRTINKINNFLDN